MQVIYMGNPPYYNISIDGLTVEVDGETYNLEELRRDSEVIIDFLDENKNFKVNIIIPPNEYDLIESGLDGDGNSIFENRLRQLNPDKVKIIVWQKIENLKQQEV